MTDQLPDDMFIENSTLPAQLAAGNAMPQPGIVVEGDDREARKSGSNRAGMVVFGVFVALLVAVGGLVAWIAVGSQDGASELDPVPQETTLDTGGEAPGSPLSSAASMYDKYIAKTEDESIFLIIPETEEGWDYFRAFMYKITDYKVAEQIGGALDAETTAEMLALEQRFLALEDLELTVDITRTDGTRFVHDGKPPTE